MAAAPSITNQPLLLRPESRFTPQKSGMIPIEAIAHEECHVSDELSSNLVAFGILQPVVLTGERKYTIVDGRRRVKVAHVAQIAEIPYVWYESMADALAAVAQLSLGSYLRNDNLYAEIQALERLTGANANEKQISAAIGVPIKKVTKRMRLLKLHELLRPGLLDGSIPADIAFKVCGWTEAEQQQVVAIHRAQGKLTFVNIAHIRPGKPRDKAEKLPGLELTPLQQSGANLIGYLDECRGRLGEHISGRIGNLFNQIANFADEIADEALEPEPAQKLKIVAEDFRKKGSEAPVKPKKPKKDKPGLQVVGGAAE